MPVRRVSPVRAADQDQLVDELVAEWCAPSPTATEPVILEEADVNGDIVHIYGVWSRWAHMDRTARGEVIMEAAERIKSPVELLKITIAMGLTPDEADRFGLKWR